MAEPLTENLTKTQPATQSATRTAAGPHRHAVPGQGSEDRHALLCEMRALQVAANKAEMARARVMVRLHGHLCSDVQARRANDPHFTAPPLTETITETQPVTGQTEGRIRSDLRAVLLMDGHLPWLAALVDEGRLDLYRAKPVTDALDDDLTDHPEARQRFCELMERWFATAAGASPGLLNKTIVQIRNHVHYVLTKVLPNEFDRRFRKRYAERRVSTWSTGDGMAALTIDTDTISVRLAHHHLDLLARKARSSGDERTLEQLRADLAIDLLTGRAGSAAQGGTTGRWARPVINVTVPATTLMGLSDQPGRMGEEVIPASLVRKVAADPEATWYRMLTDPARGCVELSTTAYSPTAAIWRQVVADRPTCFAPTCTRPATECELDHRVRYPEGPTSTDNLSPGCSRDHRAKHAPGASLGKGKDGALRWTTRAGMTHLVAPAEQPLCDDPQAGRLWQALLTADADCGELLEALGSVRHHRRIVHDDEQEAVARAQLVRTYRRAYPTVDAEEIEHWVWGDGTPPPRPHSGMAPSWDRPPEPAVDLEEVVG